MSQERTCLPLLCVFKRGMSPMRGWEGGSFLSGRLGALLTVLPPFRVVFPLNVMATFV